MESGTASSIEGRNDERARPVECRVRPPTHRDVAVRVQHQRPFAFDLLDNETTFSMRRRQAREQQTAEWQPTVDAFAKVGATGDKSKSPAQAATALMAAKPASQCRHPIGNLMYTLPGRESSL